VRVAFANLSEVPGDLLEGMGFTGAEVRQSFKLAARGYPVEIVYYDNARDNARALRNVQDAIARPVDVYVQYHDDAATNAEAARLLKAAGIPALAIHFPLPGCPLYTPDNAAAGRLAGEALADFALRTWPDESLVAAAVGPVAAREGDLQERVEGVAQGLHSGRPGVPLERLDTRGRPGAAAELVAQFLAAHPGRKALFATLDDATALAAKEGVSAAGRLPDCVIVSHGCDRSVHGSAEERKEIHPFNRGSILLGSVAFYLDRYGYDVLPLAVRLAQGEPVPARTVTMHRLITQANVFKVYPIFDMN
jgi:ABC-type sugar transport system substrate-binding protein